MEHVFQDIFQDGLENWDGKDLSVLETIYSSHSSDPYFPSTLILGLQQSGLQEKAAAWLLKKHGEHAGPQSPEIAAEVYALCKNNDFSHWETRLCLLQAIAYLPIESGSVASLEWYLRQNLSNENTFIRAWAYNGFYELARLYPQYRNETVTLFEMGLRDEPASVKARIRNVLKKGFPDLK